MFALSDTFAEPMMLKLCVYSDFFPSPPHPFVPYFEMTFAKKSDVSDSGIARYIRDRGILKTGRIKLSG